MPNIDSNALEQLDKIVVTTIRSACAHLIATYLILIAGNTMGFIAAAPSRCGAVQRARFGVREWGSVSSTQFFTVLDAALQRLANDYETISISFSGGIDSAYCLHRLYQVCGPERVIPVYTCSVIRPIVAAVRVPSISAGCSPRSRREK